MKFIIRNVLIAMLLWHVPIPLLAQDCLSSGITFINQADIDNFSTNFPGCTNIEGNVIISGAGINNLNGLSSLISIGGGLNISSCPNLSNLIGLDNLVQVGGNLQIEASAVNNLTALSQLTQVNWNIYLLFNPNLTTLGGLEGLTTVNGALEIDSNGGLTSLNGLQNITSVGSLLIFQNQQLEDLSGLQNLTTVNASFEVSYCDMMTSLNGLESLTSLNNAATFAGCYFNHNSLLSDISKMANTTAGSAIELFINECPLLNDITPLDQLGQLRELTITNNSALSECAIAPICNYLVADGTADISNNAVGCNSVITVESQCIALPVEIVRFSGILTPQGRVKLQWATHQEKNNAGFWIEHLNRQDQWIAVDFVQGTSNNVIQNNYQKTYFSPTNTQHFYRLKQVDLDDSFSYSNIIKAVGFDKRELIKISPNPSLEYLNIQTNSPIPIIVFIFTSVGKQVGKFIRIESDTQIDISSFPPGYYVVQAIDRTGLNKNISFTKL